MDTVFGAILTVTLILDNGPKIWLMATECMSGRTGIDMSVSGSIHSDTARAPMYSITATSILVSINMAQQKDAGNIGGLMATRTLVCSKQVKSKAKVFGKRLPMSRKTQTNTRASTMMI